MPNSSSQIDIAANHSAAAAVTTTVASNDQIDKNEKNIEIDSEEEGDLLPPFVEHVTTKILPKTAKRWNNDAIQQCFQLALNSFSNRDQDSDNGDNMELFTPGDIEFEEELMDLDDGNTDMAVDNENGDNTQRWKPQELAPPLWALTHSDNLIG